MTYWQPWLGHLFHLRPRDLEDLTPEQLDDCRKEAQKSRKFG